MSMINDRLLALAHTRQLKDMTYGEIAEHIGVKYRSQAKYYLERMVETGALIRKYDGEIVPAPTDLTPTMVSLPVYGSANCGPAALYANGEISEVIHVSPKQLHARLKRGAFAVRAEGDSMNAANISGMSLRDGDYAVIEPVTWQNTLDGDYVLSVIDGMGNIKKVDIDSENKRVILRSESKELREDIIIDARDIDLYSIAGRVVDVVKGYDHE